ncbi:MAG: hypothetical protein ABIO70_16285, partial [Pseudomonadota bacterium]
MPSRSEARILAHAHPELGPGERWVGPASLVSALGRLPSTPPFARVLPCDGARGAEIWVEGGLRLSLAQLAAPMPLPAALVVLHGLAESFADLHDQGGGHGCFSPASVGWTADGLLLVRPDPALLLEGEGRPTDGLQVRDCQALGALLWRALGGPWPLPPPAGADPGLLSPGVPAEVAAALPRVCRGDERVELVLRGMLRWGGAYRLAPGRAVRQALAALRFRHGASDQALEAFLAEHGIVRLAPVHPAARPAHTSRPAAGIGRGKGPGPTTLSLPPASQEAAPGPPVAPPTRTQLPSPTSAQPPWEPPPPSFIPSATCSTCHTHRFANRLNIV